MNGSLDREVAAALAVDPSPDFVARARQRIAAESIARTWWTPSVVAAGAALAAAVIAIVVYRGSFGITADQRTPLAARWLPAVAAPAVAAQPFRAAAGAMIARSAGATIARSAKASRSTEASRSSDGSRSAILVDLREARAMRIVLDGILRGRVDLTPLAASVSSVMEPAPLDQISIAPIDTPPIVESGDSKGVHP